MASLHLNNVSDDVLSELRRRADSHHAAVEDEATSILTQALSKETPSSANADQLIARADQIRQNSAHAWVTEEFLHSAKNDGRP